MSDPDLGKAPPPLSNLQRKIRINFGLFAIFFAYYLFGAILSTPAFRETAMIPTIGSMPLGLLVSLLVFPVSWILMVIWFKKGG